MDSQPTITESKPEWTPEVDNANTRIICNYGNKRTYIANKAGIKFAVSDFSTDILPDEKREALINLCQISDEEINRVADNIFSDSESETIPLFDVEPVYLRKY